MLTDSEVWFSFICGLVGGCHFKIWEKMTGDTHVGNWVDIWGSGSFKKLSDSEGAVRAQGRSALKAKNILC